MPTMDNLEVIARLKTRPGQLGGFKSQAAEILRATREQDTPAIRQQPREAARQDGGREPEMGPFQADAGSARFGWSHFKPPE